MSTIADKLTYLNETKTQFKEKLNKLGAEILDNATFRSYLTYLDNLYNGLYNLTDLSKNGIVGRTSQDGIPIPTIPQEIKNLNGDITYSVSGKNLIPFSDIISTGGTTSNGITFTLQADGTIKANGTATAGISIYLTTNYIEQKAGTYTFSDGIASGQSGTTFFLYADVRHLDETSWDTKNFSTAETITRTRTMEEAFKFKPRIVIRQGQVLNNLIFKPMLEVGSTATNYEEYKGASYPISLGVENLVNPNLYNMDGSVNVVSFNEGEVISSSITGYGGVRIALGQNIDLKTNDEIYVRLKIKSDVAGDVFNTIQLMNSSNAVITTTDTKVLAPTMTTEYQEYIMKFVLGTDDTLNKIFIQHKGSSNNTFIIKDIQVSYTNGSYTPYGKAIELCKIGTYQDRIFKSSGKNLVDVSNLSNVLITPSTGVETEIQSWRATDYNDGLKPNTTYCVSWVSSSDYFQVAVIYYDENKNYLSGESLTTSGVYEKTFTTPSNFKYYRITYSVNVGGSSVTRNLIQIEQNTTRTSYEPYGKDWYLNKQIGKVVFKGDSAENYGINSNWDDQATNILHIFTNDIRDIWKSGQMEFLSDRFICTIESGRDFTKEMITCHTTNSTPYFFISYDNLSGVSSSSTVAEKNTAFKTWLRNNNTSLYFALAIPTYEKITSASHPTLYNQLKEIQDYLIKYKSKYELILNYDKPNIKY